MLDTAINFGTVIDTERKKSLSLHIGIKDGTIAALEPLPLIAKTVIDATGMIVSPGFIDVHGHVDGYDYSGELSACQGITTTIGGNCGLSPVNLKAFFNQQENRGFYINQAELVGHSFSLRKAVGIKDVYAPASAVQISQMTELAEQALQEGACGISFGLDYSPGASFDEICALAKLCAGYGRMMPIHTRVTTQSDLYSLYEVLSIARRTGVRLLFSHYVYQYGIGIMEEALDILNRAIDNGIDVQIDSGMYTDWATAIGTATFDERTIADNELVLGAMVVATGQYIGKRLDKKLYHLLREQYPDEAVICFEGRKEDIYTALKQPYAMPSTDIGTYPRGQGHPQIAGSFPKFFKEMVRERKELTIEEAVCKATILSANTFQLTNKGVLKKGADADITIFDLNRLEDRACFPHLGRPDEQSVGIEYVLVNGKMVVKAGTFTGERAGKPVRI